MRIGFSMSSPLFKNFTVLESLKDDLANPEALQIFGKNNIEQQLQNLEPKLQSPPSYTTVRLSTMQMTVEAARDALATNFPEHEVFIHDTLTDVIVIAPSFAKGNPEPERREIVVGLKCGMSVLRGANVNVPGILRAPSGMQRGDSVSVFVDIDHKCLRGMVKPFNGNKIFVGNGISLFSRSEIFVAETASGVAIQMTERIYQCPSLGDIFSQQLFLQNLPSIVCGHVVKPLPDQTVLDMCASPGGKSTHLALLMENKGTVIALDKSQPKVDRILANGNRFGLTCIRAFKFDSTKSWNPAATLSNVSSDLEPPFASETFDHVLLDAPCSGLGQRPQLCNKMTLSELKSYPRLQKKLFSNAVHLVKTNGTLTYSTCTITLAENEEIVKWALDNYPQLQLIKQEPCIGEEGWPGAHLEAANLSLLQRFGPPLAGAVLKTQSQNEHCPNDDTIGFFIAKFVKERPTKSLQKSLILQDAH